MLLLPTTWLYLASHILYCISVCQYLLEVYRVNTDTNLKCWNIHVEDFLSLKQKSLFPNILS